MTEKLYQTDSYLKEFDAVVTEVNLEERTLLLDKSAFYPGGGGQPYDLGWITTGEQTYTLKRAKAARTASGTTCREMNPCLKKALRFMVNSTGNGGIN